MPATTLRKSAFVCCRTVCCIETSTATSFVKNRISQVSCPVEQAADLSSHCINSILLWYHSLSLSELLLIPMRSTCKVLRMVSFLSCRISSPTNFTMPEMAVAVSDDTTSFAPTNALSSFACTCTWLHVPPVKLMNKTQETAISACVNLANSTMKEQHTALHAQLACAASNCCNCKLHCNNLAEANLCLELLNLAAQFSSVPVLLQVRLQLLLGIWEHDVIHKGDRGQSSLNVQDHCLRGTLGPALVPLRRSLSIYSDRTAVVTM